MSNYQTWLEYFNHAVETNRLAHRVERIRQSDQWCSADAFDRTACLLAEDARSAGLSDVEVAQGVPGRGQGSGEWTQWERWSVHGAQLKEASTGQCLADYIQCPYHLALFSTPTPPEGITAPVAICDDPADLESGRVNVRGKLVLSRFGCRYLRPPALAAGAVGLIIDSGVKASDQDVSWQKLGYGCWPPGPRTFAFSISRRTGAVLRKRIETGEQVILTAQVDTAFSPGGAPWVTAAAPAPVPDASEVLMKAHAFEPGVIDNASGVGAIWEIASVIRKATASGVLPPLRRSLRILSMYESFGLADYIRQRARNVRHTVADVNVDCLGVAGLEIKINRQPLFLPNLIDNEVEMFCPMASRTSKVPWKTRPFAYGDDIFLSDPFYGVPTVEFLHDVAYDGYHNSRDDGRHLDIATLADVTAHIATFIYGLLTLDSSVLRVQPVPRKPARNLPGLDLVPHRTHPGLPMLENLPTGEHRKRILDTQVHGHALLWADGKRTLSEIFCALEEEGHPPAPENLRTYFQLLEEIGYCRLDRLNK